MFYRLSQFYNAVRPKIEPEEYLWLDKVLSPQESKLFYKQALPDRRHALDVARDIEKQIVSIEKEHGKDAYQDLLRAALLHDCGKSIFPPRLWQRIFIAVRSYLPNNCRLKIATKQNIFGKTLYIYQQHPLWGKHLAVRAGCQKEIPALIENHHTPTNSLEKILAEADSRH